MNAQARPAEQQSARDAALTLVKLFVPGADEAQAQLRARLRLAVDRAHSKGSWAVSPEVARLYDSAGAIAGQWWSRRWVESDELEQIIELVTRLFLCAAKLERLEQPDG